MSDQKGFAHLLSIIVILIGVIVGVYLVGQKTNLFPKASYSPSDLDSNLVAYWKMDEETDLLMDSAGSDNNGHPQGAAIIPGIIGKGRTFNGTSDYINIDTGNTFKFGSGDFSYSAWIKINSLDNSTLSGNNGRIVGDDANGNALKALVYEKGNKIAFWCRDTSGNTIHALSDTTVNDDRWHHIVAVRQGQAGLLFIDGRPVNSARAGPSALGSCDAGASHDIGARNTNPRSLFFQGSIDEVGVWNRALSAENVLFIYNNGQGRSYPFTSATPNPSPSSSPQLNPHVFTLEYDNNSSPGSEVDLNFNKVTKAFYQKYPDKDVYDFLAVFPTFPWIGESAFGGLYTTVSNNVRGICKAVTKAYKEDWGSEKLQGFHLYPSDLGEDFLTDPIFFNRVLLEETGHQWLTNIGKKNNSWPPGQPPDGVNSSCLQTDIPLLLSDDLHWSKGLVMPYDTFGGVREARPWRDNGDGTFSFDPKTEEVQRKFHPFDLYLMGLMDKSEVQGEFSLLTEMEDPYQGFGFPPGGGIQPNPKNNFPTTRAKVIKLTIDDIINIAGEERKPGVSESQKDFKLAFVILLKKGELPSKTRVQAITASANIFPQWWAYATDYRSTINK